jgi:hypothetical protein
MHCIDFMHFPLKGEPAMRLHRMIRALDRFEDSPWGMVFGLAVPFAMMLIPLYLNEAGVR